MVLLTKRQISITEFLSRREIPVSIKELSNIFNVSTRSVYYDLKKIEYWTKTNGFVLLKDSSKGILLKGAENSKVELPEVISKVLEKEDRATYILTRLLTATDHITAQQFSDELCVSRSTILNDIYELKGQLIKDSLFIHGEKSHGFILKGKESDFRDYITELIINHTPVHELLSIVIRGGKISDLKPYMQNFFPELAITSIKDAIKVAKQSCDFWIPDLDYVKFIIYQAISVKRISQGKLIEQDTFLSSEIKNYKEYSIAKNVHNILGRKYNITINENEVINTAKILLRCNIKTEKKSTKECGKDIPLHEALEKMIKVLMDYTSFNSCAYSKLKSALLEHLKLTLKQRQFGIVTENKLLDKIKINYSQSYEMAEKMAVSFSEVTNIILPESEIGFIAMHVAVYLEVDKKQADNIRVIVICSSGKGAANVLSKRLQTSFPDLLIKGTYSVFEVEENGRILEDVDFIVSTIDYSNATRPVVKVSPLLTDGELYLIENFMNGDKRWLNVQPTQSKSSTFKYLYDRLEGIVGIPMTDILKQELEEIVCYFDENFVPKRELENGLENINDGMAMIVLRAGDLIKKLENAQMLNLKDDQVQGLFIHLLMSIARWEKGSFNEEPDIEKYQNINAEMYAIVHDFLTEIGEQMDRKIPETEIVAIMRYLI